MPQLADRAATSVRIKQAVLTTPCSPTRRQPYSTYAVYLTTLSPPAFVGDSLLLWLLWKAVQDWQDPTAQKLAIYSLLAWMLMSKFSKNLGHYIRYPGDFLLLPVSIVFGWLHGLIKLYALATIHNVSQDLDLSEYLSLICTIAVFCSELVLSACLRGRQYPTPLLIRGADSLGKP